MNLQRCDPVRYSFLVRLRESGKVVNQVQPRYTEVRQSHLIKPAVNGESD